MSLTAVWSDEALAHDPHGEVWIGVPIEGDEIPARGQMLKQTIDELGIERVEPEPHDDVAVLAVHEAGMLEYLRSAYYEWVAAGYPEDHGQDRVVAYAFRHPGAFDHVRRRQPRSRAAMAGVYCMDTCTVVGPGTFRGVRYAVDASLTGADLVLAGKAHAYAAVRPPGHHAGTDYFGGSCYLNNAAIAAHHLVSMSGSRVGIVDIDAHHGNGTQQIFYDRDDVSYTSVHVDPGEGWFPHWSGFADETGRGNGLGHNHNLPQPPGSGDDELIDAVSGAAAMVASSGAEILVVSLGVDSGAADPNSPFAVTTEGFTRFGAVLAELGLPTLLVHEGGYSLPDLSRDTAAVLTAFIDAG